MALWPFRSKKKTESRAEDPLTAFDGFIEDLERQGAEIRRSAATLIALRSDLTRTEERQRMRLTDVRDRLAEARTRGDHRAIETLMRDEVTVQKLLASTEESLARASTDAELLLEAAKDLGRELEDLRAERTSAQARLAAGMAITTSMRQRAAQFKQVLALDKARDEVERAHALADIYREEKAP